MFITSTVSTAQLGWDLPIGNHQATAPWFLKTVYRIFLCSWCSTNGFTFSRGTSGLKFWQQFPSKEALWLLALGPWKWRCSRMHSNTSALSLRKEISSSETCSQAQVYYPPDRCSVALHNRGNGTPKERIFFSCQLRIPSATTPMKCTANTWTLSVCLASNKPLEIQRRRRHICPLTVSMSFMFFLECIVRGVWWMRACPLEQECPRRVSHKSVSHQPTKACSDSDLGATTDRKWILTHLPSRVWWPIALEINVASRWIISFDIVISCFFLWNVCFRSIRIRRLEIRVEMFVWEMFCFRSICFCEMFVWDWSWLTFFLGKKQ